MTAAGEFSESELHSRADFNRLVELSSSQLYSRAEVLRLFAGATLGAGLLMAGLAGDSTGGRIYEDEVRDMLDAAPQELLPVEAETLIPDLEQVAVPSNPQFAPLGRTATRAYVVVHPGYVTSQVGDTVERYGDRYSSTWSDSPVEWRRAAWERFGEEYARESDRVQIRSFTDILRGAEGDYATYRAQLAHLFDVLRTTDEPVIMYLEERAAYRGNQQYPDLAIPDNALMVVTKQGDPEPVPFVRYMRNGELVEERQYPGLVFDWLRDLGVQDVDVAGEYGLSRGGGIFPACLGAVVEAFIEEGFSVHGIRGAIFPSAPLDLDNPDADGRQWHWPMAQALHVDTVPMPA